MREARLHPTSEEIDDYIEYKRLREEHHDKMDSVQRTGVYVEAIEEEDGEKEPEDEEEEDDRSTITLRLGKQHVSTWDDGASPFSTIQDEVDPFKTTGGLTPSRSRPRHASLDTVTTVSPSGSTPGGMFDGANSEARGSLVEARGSISSVGSGGGSPSMPRRFSKRPSLVSTHSVDRIRQCCNMTEAEIRDDQISWIRRDSAHYSRDSSKNSTPRKFRGSLVNISETCDASRNNSIVSYAPDHKTLHGLAANVRNLREVTLRKDSVGSAFMDDLKAMHEIVTHWQMESAETKGYVDECLKNLETDIEVMKEHGKFDWMEFATGPRGMSPVDELKSLEKYQERYAERRREEMMDGEGEEGEVGDDDGDVEEVVVEKRIVWSLGADLVFN